MSRSVLIMMHCIMDYSIIDCPLLIIEQKDSYIHYLLKFLLIILELLSNEQVALHGLPSCCHLRYRHLRDCIQRPSIFAKHAIYEIETIVIDLFLCRVCNSEWNMSEAVMQIITKIFLEAVSKFTGAGGVAVDEDYGKEVVHVMSSAHMSSILQALDPFIIVVKQTPVLTCFLESLIDNSIKCLQMCKGGSSLKT
jgi:hypothetical protein